MIIPGVFASVKEIRDNAATKRKKVQAAPEE
jgi:hypothetical protein